MPSVKAGPNEFLLIARKGALENRGSAVTSFLWPGTVWVVVPAAKQEAAFEFTQETKDGIPLRFKGIIIFRVTDPLAAAGLFDFAEGAGVARISEMLTHVVLGELRHAVSHMTMVECIEERKTTLSGVADASLRATVAPTEAAPDGWGITIEVAQLAQVFIVDTQLRQQLEAEVRNEIRLKSEQSELRTREESRLSSMASDERIEERKLGEDRERLRRQEELELAEIARRRRMKVEEVATERQHLALDQERVEARLAAEQARLAAETPVKLLRLAREAEVLQAELAVRELRNRVRALEVVHELAGRPRPPGASRRAAAAGAGAADRGGGVRGVPRRQPVDLRRERPAGGSAGAGVRAARRRARACGSGVVAGGGGAGGGGGSRGVAAGHDRSAGRVNAAGHPFRASPRAGRWLR